MDYQLINKVNLQLVVIILDFLLYLRLKQAECNKRLNFKLNAKVLIGIKMD